MWIKGCGVFKIQGNVSGLQALIGVVKQGVKEGPSVLGKIISLMRSDQITGYSEPQQLRIQDNKFKPIAKIFTFLSFHL